MFNFLRLIFLATKRKNPRERGLKIFKTFYKALTVTDANIQHVGKQKNCVV